MGTPDYPKKRHIAKRTVTTRLFTDDEREVQRRVTHEGKDRSEILRQAVSNAFRTERLAGTSLSSERRTSHSAWSLPNVR